MLDLDKWDIGWKLSVSWVKCRWFDENRLAGLEDRGKSSPCLKKRQRLESPQSKWKHEKIFCRISARDYHQSLFHQILNIFGLDHLTLRKFSRGGEYHRPNFWRGIEWCGFQNFHFGWVDTCKFFGLARIWYCVFRKSSSRCWIWSSEISDESPWQAELNASGLKKIGGKVAELEADESKIVPSKIHKCQIWR